MLRSSTILRIMSYVLAVLIVLLIVVLVVTKPFKDITTDQPAQDITQIAENTAPVDKSDITSQPEETPAVTAEPEITQEPEITAEPTFEPAATPTPEVETPVEPDLSYGLVFEEKNDYIETNANVNLRKGASKESEKVAYLADATRMLRTGYNKEWTRVVYNGIVCYIYTPLVAFEVGSMDATPTPKPTATPVPVTPEDPTYGLTFTDTDDYVDTKSGINLRSGCSTETVKVAFLENSERLHRTGVSDTWTRVEYNGTTCYLSNGLVVRVVESMDTVVNEE